MACYVGLHRYPAIGFNPEFCMANKIFYFCILFVIFGNHTTITGARKTFVFYKKVKKGIISKQRNLV